MRIVEFKESLTMAIDNKRLKIQPKHMYLFADVIWASFKQRLVELIKGNQPKVSDEQIKFMLSKIIKSDKNIEEALTKFNLNEVDNKKKGNIIFPIILRTGGIGDLIALSSISRMVPEFLGRPSDTLRFVSQEKYRAVFDWYEKPIQFVSYFSPVAKYAGNNAIDKNSVNRRYKPIFFEGVIENSKENWYNIQYSTIGAETFDRAWGRPMLKTKRINNTPSNIDTTKRSVLLNCRSTAIIRSMRFQDLYESLITCIGDMDVNIYTHKRNLREEDMKFIESLDDDRVKLIEAKSLGEFFLDSYDATLSISVDTAMFHFREGIQKPAIGLYGPFPYECRTKYYQYTKSLNISSNCQKMPCYIHVKTPTATCEFHQQLTKSGQYDEKWKDVAPCCCEVWNNTVQDQIVGNFKAYILETLSN